MDGAKGEACSAVVLYRASCCPSLLPLISPSHGGCHTARPRGRVTSAEGSETEGVVVAVARAVGGDEGGSVAAYDKVSYALVAAVSRLEVSVE